jgi:PAS domain S-box-containing protein
VTSVSPNPNGIALLCDSEGRILEIIGDRLGLASRFPPGRLFGACLDSDSLAKSLDFLLEIRAHQATFGWEFQVAAEDRHDRMLVFDGCLVDGRLAILGAASSQELLGIRFALTRLNNELAERKRDEETLRLVAESGARSGEDVFHFLVRQLAVSQGKRHALVARIDEGDPSTAHTVAAWSDGAFAANFSYEVEGAPAGNVVAQGTCFYPRDVQKLFPRCPVLPALGAESYWGTPLRDAAGNLLGLLALIDDRPMEATPQTLSLLNSFAARVAAELSRQRTEEKYRTLFNEMLEGFALHEIVCDPAGKPVDYRFLAVNPAFERMTGLRAADIAGKSVSEVLPNLDAGFVEAHWRVILTGEPARLENYVTELGKWFEINLFRPEKGRFAAILRDITERKRAEEALQASEERLRLTLEAAQIVAWEEDPFHGTLYETGPVDKVFGRAEGFRHRDIDDVTASVHPEDRQRFAAAGHAARRGECDFNVEVRVVPDGGGEKWIASHGTWLRDAEGKPARMLGVTFDITERKQHEADRETTLALLRLLTAPNDARELIRTVAGLLQEWSGCEAVGIRLREGDDFPYYETRGFPPEFVRAENSLCARDEAGETLRDSQGNPVLECICGNVLDGRTNPRLPFFTAHGSFWTNSTTALLASTTEADRQSHTRSRCHGEGYESVALIPLRYSSRTLGLVQLNDPRSGRFTLQKVAFLERAAGSIAIALEQRSTQAALRASEARYRLISENTSDVIWLLDVETRRFTYVSPSVQRLRGYSPAEVMAQPLESALTAESYQFFKCASEERLGRWEAGDKQTPEQTYIGAQPRRDGSIVRTETTATLLPDAQGRICEVLGVTRDITERLKAEARLMQAQKMESVGRLAGGVAHDFNNLLTIINGYSKMTLNRLTAKDPLRDTLEEIHKAGRRAAALTQQLLAFSRKQVLQPRLLDLNAVVSGIKSMIERLVGEDVELRVELHLNAVTTRADPHQLEEVLMNLAVNSRDAMPHGGTLTIRTSSVEIDAGYVALHPEARVGRYAVLAVTDSGVGMKEETRRHIFEPFFTTKEVGKGTGLGLSMIHGIVEQSGGFIELSSEPGIGATFRIYLPGVEGAADDGMSEAGPAPGGRETVLVVEDQAEVGKYVSAALRTFGYQVIQVESAAEALAVCQRESERIDLVLTDVVMPNFSGPELAGWLKDLGPAIKVLFMSGYTDAAIVHRGFLEAGVEFIQKPFSPDQLAVKVREVLGAPKSTARILVADDEAGIRGYLRATLERAGYEVTEAADGRQALKEARKGGVDLVITDLVMPEQEGIETIRALRKEMPGIGIIAISGAFGGQFLEAARILGADASLGKPVSAELLLAKVAEVLKLRR